ncbi:hypothetical protein BASA61_002086 [Batrachochytrium salamandrivorans]|nr:hypothetical protein BASA61_002086 [Batrachochytrium salamandrivorans]
MNIKTYDLLNQTQSSSSNKVDTYPPVGKYAASKDPRQQDFEQNQKAVKVNSCNMTGIKHLMIRPKDCETLMTAIAESDKITQNLFSRLIQLEIYTFVHYIGLTPIQCAVWLTIFKKSHDEHIAQLQSTDRVNTSLGMSIFHQNFKLYFFYAGKPVFSAYESKILIDYIAKGYGRHTRLIINVFTTYQEVSTEKMSKMLQVYSEATPFLPLAQGILEERWDEVCRLEENNALLARMAEEEAKTAARLQAAIDAKIKADYEEAAALVQQQKIAERGLFAPFVDLPHTDTTLPTIEKTQGSLTPPLVLATQKVLDHDKGTTFVQMKVPDLIKNEKTSPHSTTLLSLNEISHALVHNATDIFSELTKSLMFKMDMQTTEMETRIDRLQRAISAREAYRSTCQKEQGEVSSAGLISEGAGKNGSAQARLAKEPPGKLVRAGSKKAASRTTSAKKQ